MRFADVPMGAQFRFEGARTTATPYREIPEFTFGRQVFNAELPSRRAHRKVDHWYIKPDDEVQVAPEPA